MEFMDGAIISTPVERVVDYAFNLSQTLFDFGNEYQASAKEIEKLRTMFGDLYCVLEVASENQSGNPEISLWLTDLADLAYETEDILEEIEYEYKQTQQQQDNILQCNFLKKRKRSEVPDKLEEITIRLNKLYERKKVLNRFMRNPSVPKRRQIRELDGSKSIESIIYGREREKDEIVELLLEPNNRSESVGVIPIVGMGGIGKTTLAQHVLNDNRVADCFEKRVWVCVSMEYDKCSIYKRIIEFVTAQACDIKDECSMENKVRSKLSNKKFLIILDDVWNEDMYAMNKLFEPFQFGAPNSKIVLTTRNRKIANQLKTVNRSIELIGLSDKDCLSIFRSHERLDTESCSVAIGKQLSKICAGNPLAAAVMGSLFRGNHNKDASLIFEKGRYEIMSVLKLSYDAMPNYLKPCFLCCTMFPYDYRFQKDFIVEIWISSGLISVGGRDKVESLAGSYFDELVSKCLLSKSSNSGHPDSYVMHDLIRDMGQMISGNIYCRLEHDVVSFDKKRHLTVHESLIAQINHSLEGDTGHHSLPLRTFLPIGGQMERVYDLDNFILRAKNLRVLSFQKMGISKIPEYIDELIHLRYLDMSSCSNLKDIPSEIGNLFNLEYLNISGCQNLTTLPLEIGCLMNLTYLDINYCSNLTTLPSEIGTLINLTHLDISGCRNLTTLPSEIGTLINLTHLDISGCANLTTLPSEIGTLINLTHLDISGCGNLTTLPSEIDSLINLTFIDICHCERLTTIPSKLASRFNLTVLRTSYSFDGLPSEMTGLVTSYSFDDLPSEIDCSSINVPHSANFQVRNESTKLTLKCNPQGHQMNDDLQEFHLPQKELQELSIDGYYGLHFPYWLAASCVYLKHLTVLMLLNCVNCRSLIMQALPSLETLVVSHCLRLEIILPRLPSLTHLEVQHCSKLDCVKEFSLASVKDFIIEDIRTVGSTLLEKIRRSSHRNAMEIPPNYSFSDHGEDITSTSFGDEEITVDVLVVEEQPSLLHLPHWVCGSKSIKSLRIQACPQLKTLSLTGYFPTTLSLIQIKGCEELTSISPQRTLPIKLEKLIIYSCPKLGIIAETMPNELLTLDIRYCPTLTTLSPCCSLQSLSLIGCSPEILKSLLAEEEHDIFPNLKKLVLAKFPAWVSLPQEESNKMTLPKSVSCLKLDTFPNLKHLSSSLQLGSLVEISIANCQELVSLPEAWLSASELKINIGNCLRLQRKLESKRNLQVMF